MWRLYRPSEREAIEFLMRSAHEPLNSEVHNGPAPTKLRRRVHLGHGEELLRRCAGAMQRWCMVPGEMVDLYWPERPMCQGTVLATGIRMAGVYWLNPCRITECRGMDEGEIGEGECVRMRWEALRGHCLVGHESFHLGIELRGRDVFYEVSSTASPVPWLGPWRRTIDRMRCEFQRLSCDRFVTIAKRLSRLGGGDAPADRRRTGRNIPSAFAQRNV